jgi:hypothetical protein
MGSTPGRGKAHSSIAYRSLRTNQGPVQHASAVLSLGTERPGREADHSPSSRLQVKDGGAILRVSNKSL